MLGSGSRLIGSQLALVWIQLCHLFVPQLWWWDTRDLGPALLTTLLALRPTSNFTTTMFVQLTLYALLLILGSLSYGPGKWWKIGQLSFFDGHIFGGRWPGYYDRDYKWWRSSSKLHFSLYLDHSGCPGQGRSWFQNRNNDGMISTSGRKWFQIWNWEQHLAWLGSWVVWTECLIWFLFIDKWARFKVQIPTKSLKLHKANMKMEMKVWRLRKGGLGWIPLVIDIICSRLSDSLILLTGWCVWW